MNKALKEYRKTPYRLTKYGKKDAIIRSFQLSQAFSVAISANAQASAIMLAPNDGSSDFKVRQSKAILKTISDSMGAIKSALTINTGEINP